MTASYIYTSYRQSYKRMFNRKILIFLVLILSSCSKIIPAEFWREFDKDEIVHNFSDHGPFGGTTIIDWASDNNKLDKNSIISFAEKNGWKLVDVITVQDGELKSSKKNYSVELIVQNNNFSTDFKNSTVYLFETGIIAVKPGNSAETQINGFLILNNNKTKLKLFHKWGE